MVTIKLELSDLHAQALAQFVKRVGWQEFRQNAVDDTEADEIRYALDQLQKALSDSGYAPR